MAYLSKYTGPDIDRRLTQGTYDDAVAAGFTGSKEEFDKLLAHPYSPSDQEIINNKQDKEDAALETENKTVVGAINFLNSNKQDKTDERLTTDSKIVIEAINEVKYSTIVLDQKKQPREDLGFSTEQKTVVGAVNELNLKIGELDESKQNTEDDRLDTNDTTVVGAINEVHRELDKLNSEYGQHIDDYEAFKSNTNSSLTTVQESITNLRNDKQNKTDYDLNTSDKRITFAINEVNDNLKAEIERSKTTDETLEKIKVPYTDISDGNNPNRRTILLKNHDSISGYGTDGTVAYNIAMVSKWNKADFGAAGIPINLNGSEDHPTYNDSEKLAFVSELTGETSRLEEDIKNLNETITTVNQSLSADIATLNQNVIDINTDLDDEIRPAIEKNAKDIGVVNDTLTQKIEETEEKLQEDINYLKPRVTTLETLQIKSVNPDSENYAASYELQDSTGKVYGQRINIDQIPDVFETKGLTELETGESSAKIEAALGISFASLIEIIRENKTVIVDRNSAGDYKACIHASGNISGGNGAANLMFFIGTTPTIYQVQYVNETFALAVDEYTFAKKSDIPDISNLATKEEITSKVDWVDYNNTKNIVLPSNGQVFGDFGGEESNSSLLGARIYNAGLENEEKQVEVGTSKVHLNLNSSDKPTIETPDGKENLVVESDIELMSIEVNFPVRTSGGSDGPEDRVYTQEEILQWFGVVDIAALKKQINNKGIQYIKYGIMLMGNPYYYRMPVQYAAFESANQVKLVFIGLNTNNDVASKYEIIMNLDGTIIEGNSNVKMTITSIEPKVYDDTQLKNELQQTEMGVASNLTEIEKLQNKITELENRLTALESN